MQKRNESPEDNHLNPDQEALRDKLLTDSDETNLDRSVTRDADFGGGFGEGHYTGTSWDPEINPNAPDQTNSEHKAEHSHRRNPTVHDKDYGSAGAGKLGGVQGPGLTTGGASPTSPR
jgi:hypothetical protein